MDSPNGYEGPPTRPTWNKVRTTNLTSGPRRLAVLTGRLGQPRVSSGEPRAAAERRENVLRAAKLSFQYGIGAQRCQCREHKVDAWVIERVHCCGMQRECRGKERLTTRLQRSLWIHILTISRRLRASNSNEPQGPDSGSNHPDRSVSSGYTHVPIMKG